jgi:hypothetical protein
VGRLEQESRINYLTVTTYLIIITVLLYFATQVRVGSNKALGPIL